MRCVSISTSEAKRHAETVTNLGEQAVREIMAHLAARGFPLDLLLAGAHAELMEQIASVYGIEAAARAAEDAAKWLRDPQALAEAELRAMPTTGRA